MLNGIECKDPELVFFNPIQNSMCTNFHPMRGLTNNSPYDFALGTKISRTSINLGVICPINHFKDFQQFLNELNNKHSVCFNTAYVIPFPGFFNAFKYIDSEDCNPEKSNIAMALYIQRWKLHNALIPIKIFAQFIEKSLHKDTLAGDLYSAQVGVLPFTDHLRPCIVSPNIQLPYIIGAWENYIKNSYLSILKYVDTENKMIKPDKLSADDLEKIRTGESSVEECIVSKFSFQRPQTIINNFGQLDKKLDVNTVFDKPYKRRKIKLKTSIDNIITLRNQIVHDGFMDVKLTDKDVKRFLDEVEEAANRLYKLFAKNYGFKANFDF